MRQLVTFDTIETKLSDKSSTFNNKMILYHLI